ncbi:DUF4199 domain-containing protein [Pedobacter sp. MC2016-14]|uniref:DUF4199 domain-containing protein n=1 Tax=Pedobacter sp. MC2016-14 TaxID=2897327 RepID=UPI001E2EE28E|nr:DUF4199 domain-containing protein [Pedobacter sp. MC2016-14]MCD0488540.1 DUF4199 domain-containing protein [Pedobacter sp. MC2016-14]
MEQFPIAVEKKPNMLAFKTALAYTAYFLVLIYLLKWLGIDTNNPDISTLEKAVAQVASYVPFILAVVYVQSVFKKELDNYISFKEAFSAGFKVAAYAGLFIGILLVFYYLVLDRAAFSQLMDISIAAAKGDREKIRAVEMMRSYMPFFIGFSAAIMYTVLGLIVSLIGAAIVKSEKPLNI